MCLGTRAALARRVRWPSILDAGPTGASLCPCARGLAGRHRGFAGEQGQRQPPGRSRPDTCKDLSAAQTGLTCLRLQGSVL